MRLILFLGGVLLTTSFSTTAKSECYDLATYTFFNSDLAPAYLGDNAQEQMKESLLVMHDSEIFCKRTVKALKTGKTSSADLRKVIDKTLSDAQNKYEKDGDVDSLELTKLTLEVLKGSIKIAEK